MNVFTKNYWSLYLDFLDDFEKLNYNGISIPYLFCHFYSVVKNNNKILSKLYDESFHKQLTNQISDGKEIQRKFNIFMESHTNSELVKRSQGRVVVHADKLLRFSNKIFLEYLEQPNSIILSSARSYSKIKIKSGSADKKKKAKLLNHIPTKIKNTPTNRENTTKKVNRIPIDYLDNYSINREVEVIQLQNEARNIFKNYIKHPLYSDQQFQSTFLEQIPKIIKCIEESNRFFEKVSVSCIVVSTTHSYINRILVLAATKKGIPSICMQHGIIANEFGYLPKIAMVDAVYGEFEVDWYEKRGAPVESIEIIGNPRFDEIFTRTAISRSQFNKKLGLDSTKKTLMVTVRERYDIDKWRILIKTILKKCDINIVIKDYPGKESDTLLKEFPSISSTKNFHLYDILPNVDVVVAYPSTVGLEAMLADKPVFILDNTGLVNTNFKNETISLVNSLTNNPGYTNYYNSLGKMVQANPTKLGELIVNYFSEPQWESEIKLIKNNFLSYTYQKKDLSGERLKKLINNLTN